MSRAAGGMLRSAQAMWRLGRSLWPIALDVRVIRRPAFHLSASRSGLPGGEGAIGGYDALASDLLLRPS